MKFQPALKTTRPETLINVPGIQPGQWIDCQGVKGRWMGVRHGTIWIAWGRSATHTFSTFAKAFRKK